MVITIIDHHRQAVCNNNLFKKPPKHSPKSFANRIPVVLPELVQLRKKMSWSFYRTGHQLWIEHHIKGVRQKIFFRRLLSPVHFDCITHRLESMKRQPDGE